METRGLPHTLATGFCRYSNWWARGHFLEEDLVWSSGLAEVHLVHVVLQSSVSSSSLLPLAIPG
jgi:hypothetical protein